jgi:hypothetical protein
MIIVAAEVLQGPSVGVPEVESERPFAFAMST